MSNSERFDETIKNALDNIEEPYDASTWAQLAQRIDATMPEAPATEPAAIDDVVREALVGMEALYQSAHWAQMSRLLDQQLLRRRLLTAKAAEAAIFLLLLLNFNLFIDENSPIYQPRTTPTAPAEEPVAIHKRSNKPSRQQSIQPPGYENMTYTSDVTEAGINLLPGISDNSGQYMPDGLGHSVQTFGTNPKEVDNSRYAFANTAVMQSLPQSTVPLLYTTQTPKIQPHNSPNRTKGYFYAGAYAAHDQNRIIAPRDIQAFGGYRGGFMAGWRKGRWGVETGVAQASLHYTPKTDAIGSRTGVQSQLLAVDANMTTLSVKGLSRLGRVGKKTSVYATAGTTVSIAAYKNYRYETTIMHNAAPGSGNNPITDQWGPEYRIAKGALEGGDFARNTYISADAGLRIERPVGGRFAIFVEPVYRHAVSSNNIGPTPIRIHTMSVQAGVLATL